MDNSPRHRYYRRRQELLAGRRRGLYVAAGIALIFLVFGLAAQQMTTNRSRSSAFSPTNTPAMSSMPPTIVASAMAIPSSTQPPAEQLLELPPATAQPQTPAPFFDEGRFVYEPGFYVPQLQAYLDSQPGQLKKLAFQVGDRRHSFAEVLIGQSSYFSVNPKVLLALLELQGQLLSTASPSSDQVGWAVGYRGENGIRRGLAAQVRWAVRQIQYAKRDYASYVPLTYHDNSSMPPPPSMSMSEYAIARVLAPTTTPDRLPDLLRRFLETYTRLFDDPRSPPQGWPLPSQPFLSRPMERTAQVTSFFDHNAPFLGQNGSILTYWGRAETDIAFAYDGHDGWDYAMQPPDLALAAAPGEVVFAGNADDNCATRAVVIDHGNGYRTLYWHLHRIDVTIGQRVERSQAVGVIGASGCATGPHLHFGVQFLGRNTDPYGWCGADPDPWSQHPSGSISIWLWIDRPSPCGKLGDGLVVVDTDSPGFAKGGSGWQSVTVGYNGGSLFVPSLRGVDSSQPWELRPLSLPAVAVWQPTLPAAGRYRILAYVPYALSGLEDAIDVRYRIRHSEGEAQVAVNGQVYANDWADLGTYLFRPEDHPSVVVSNFVETNQRSVWADAVIWVPVER